LEWIGGDFPFFPFFLFFEASGAATGFPSLPPLRYLDSRETSPFPPLSKRPRRPLANLSSSSPPFFPPMKSNWQSIASESPFPFSPFPFVPGPKIRSALALRTVSLPPPPRASAADPQNLHCLAFLFFLPPFPPPAKYWPVISAGVFVPPLPPRLHLFSGAYFLFFFFLLFLFSIIAKI